MSDSKRKRCKECWKAEKSDAIWMGVIHADAHTYISRRHPPLEEGQYSSGLPVLIAYADLFVHYRSSQGEKEIELLQSLVFRYSGRRVEQRT